MPIVINSGSVAYIIKKLMWTHGVDLSLDALESLLRDQGFEISTLTIASLRRQFMSHYKFFRSVGAIGPGKKSLSPPRVTLPKADDPDHVRRMRRVRRLRLPIPSLGCVV